MEHQQDSGLSNNDVIPNAPQLIRPKVDWGISQETWIAFICRWEAFKIGSHDSDLTDKSLLIASLSNEVCNSMAITWEETVEETLNDKVHSRVSRCTE